MDAECVNIIGAGERKAAYRIEVWAACHIDESAGRFYSHGVRAHFRWNVRADGRQDSGIGIDVEGGDSAVLICDVQKPTGRVHLQGSGIESCSYWGANRRKGTGHGIDEVCGDVM